MGIRFMRRTISETLRSWPVLVMLIVLQILLLSGLFSTFLGDVERSNVEMNRELAYQPTVPEPADGEFNPAHQVQYEQAQKAQEAMRAIIAAWDAGDLAAYCEARADYLQLEYDVSGGVGTSENLGQIAFYRALEQRPHIAFYRTNADMPALTWLAADSKGVADFARMLPFIQPGARAGSGDTAEASVDTIVWALPVLTLATLGARRLRRERLADLAPVGDRSRFAFAVIGSAAAGLVVVALAHVPSLLVFGIRNGIGDLGYPVVFNDGARVVESAVGFVILQMILLTMLFALISSLMAHISVAVCNRALPGIALVTAVMLIPFVFRDYYGRCSSFRAIAPFLPCTYIDLRQSVGSVTAIPAWHELSGITFVHGVSSLGITAVVLAIVLLVAVRVFRASGVRRVNGNDDELPPACWDKDQHRSDSELLGRHFRTDAHEADHGGADSGRHFRSSPSASTRPGFGTYLLYLSRLLVKAPAYGAAVLLVAVAALFPLVFSLDPDLTDYYPSRYEGGPMHELADRVAVMDEHDPRAARMQELYDHLNAFVYAPDPASQFRALGAFESLRSELVAEGATELAGRDGSAQAAARGLLLKHMAELSDPVLYPIARKMPAAVYVPHLLSMLPSILWLLPVLALSSATASLMGGDSLVRQAPVPRVWVSVAAFFAAGALAAVAIAAPLFVGFACAAALNGIGDFAYPSACVLLGRPVSAFSAHIIAGMIGRAGLLTL
ncbi:hypothetical protein K6V98_04280 [Collinsella sp. AGMB00827]|uniref:ABC transporter permease n=1 Tax=Collinsella ureilytica TaxID=2869515 RepID=A0ABS7MKG9_9ACTN|nr:hypothetical protein [Collinsella urealyticum]MBY4797571.1 hypothetical protein [Collinsella urealyticum]